MRRVEARDLLPGDEFEYEYHSKYSRPQTQVKRDKVKVNSDGTWAYLGTRRYIDAFGERKEEVAGLHLMTEVGQTNHGYVLLHKADTVVVLISREGE